MLTKSIPYTFVRGGHFYFSRRVPADLCQHYSYHRFGDVRSRTTRHDFNIQDAAGRTIRHSSRSAPSLVVSLVP